MIETEIYFDLAAIGATAKKFLQVTEGYRKFAFSGELGAGKTSFISEICRQLGIIGTVSSPTYSIIQEYETDNDQTIFHIDLYRLKNSREAIEAGVEDCLLGNDFCMVEWPEKAPEVLPEDTVYSKLDILGDTNRKLVIHLPA